MEEEVKWERKEEGERTGGTAHLSKFLNPPLPFPQNLARSLRQWLQNYVRFGPSRSWRLTGF